VEKVEIEMIKYLCGNDYSSEAGNARGVVWLQWSNGRWWRKGRSPIHSPPLVKEFSCRAQETEEVEWTPLLIAGSCTQNNKGKEIAPFPFPYSFPHCQVLCHSKPPHIVWLQRQTWYIQTRSKWESTKWNPIFCEIKIRNVLYKFSSHSQIFRAIGSKCSCLWSLYGTYRVRGLEFRI
jgi:hypothetical protein